MEDKDCVVDFNDSTLYNFDLSNQLIPNSNKYYQC